DAGREVRDLPLSLREALARRRAFGRVRLGQDLPLARPPRVGRLALCEARRHAVLADAEVAMLAEPGPARGRLARRLAATTRLVLVVGALLAAARRGRSGRAAVGTAPLRGRVVLVEVFL